MSSSTTLTRRSLLRSAAAAAAASFVGLHVWPPAHAGAAASHLRRSSYAGLVGKSFTADSVGLKLLAVSDVAGAAVDESLAGSEDAFVLEFSGPLDHPLAGGTHTLSHPRLGQFDLFVSAVDQPRPDRRYEAVVDRSVSARAARGARVSSARVSSCRAEGRECARPGSGAA
jgi:hypothetical protein